MSDSKEFQWTDELVKDAVKYWHSKASNIGFEEAMDKFKQSKLPVPDYEILIFRGTGKKYLHEDIWDLYNGKYNLRGYNLVEGIWDLKDMLKGVNSVEDGQLEINSVKRLSDGEVFSIGDKYSYGKDGVIEKFKISDVGELLCDIRFNNIHSCKNAPLRAIDKVKIKLPLFTPLTEMNLQVTFPPQKLYVNGIEYTPTIK